MLPIYFYYKTHRNVLQNIRKPAGRGDWHALAAALEEGLEALGILLNKSRGEAKRHL